MQFGSIVAAEPLSGDASTRRFVRLRLAGGGSTVAMVLDGPIDPTAHPQIVVGAYLESLGSPIPHLLDSVPEAGLLFYEDVGDLLLQDLAGSMGLASGAWGHWDGGAHTPPVDRGGDVAEGARERLERHYEDAAAIILHLQDEGTRRLPPSHPSATSALDADRFLFELRFFREHYIEGLRDLRFGPRESRVLDEFLDSLAREAAEPPWVLCHRDFHSRNLLVQGRRLRLVDFQDARLGPAAYDLASLLRDSYVRLPGELRARLLSSFVGQSAVLSGDEARFRERFDIVALQRNLKAIGTFAYQSRERGKHGYLTYIGPTWESAFDALERLPRWSDAEEILKAAAAGEGPGED